MSASAQEKVRRLGVLMNAASDDPETQACLTALQQGLADLGWIVGRNLQMDYRWAVGELDRYQQGVKELVALSPDVLVIAGAGVQSAQRITRTVPIVFPQAVDPVGAGFVARLSRPGGNTTGFMQFEFSLVGKWLQLLREVAPGVNQVGVIREPVNPAGIGQWAALQVAAEPAGIELTSISNRDARDIERSIAALAGEPNTGLVAAVGAGTVVRRRTIIETAARHRLPAIYPYKYMATEGGLMAYGADLVGQYRRAAGYVDRLLRGEKPGDLPVQKPTRYDLTINLKAAKAQGIAIPQTLLASADEVIE
jgi:putative ABC transport system substrate-binding protein